MADATSALAAVNDDEQKRASAYAAAAQVMGLGPASQATVPEQNPSCASVASVANDSSEKIFKMDGRADGQGNLVISQADSGVSATPPVNSKGDPRATDSKRNATSTDSEQVAPSANNIKANADSSASADASMKLDKDGDGIVDGLDNKTESRAEIAAKKAEEKRSIVYSSQSRESVSAISSAINVIKAINEDSDAKNSGQNIVKGPGDVSLNHNFGGNKSKINGL